MAVVVVVVAVAVVVVEIMVVETENVDCIVDTAISATAASSPLPTVPSMLDHRVKGKCFCATHSLSGGALVVAGHHDCKPIAVMKMRNIITPTTSGEGFMVPAAIATLHHIPHDASYLHCRHGCVTLLTFLNHGGKFFASPPTSAQLSHDWAKADASGRRAATT